MTASMIGVATVPSTITSMDTTTRESCCQRHRHRRALNSTIARNAIEGQVEGSGGFNPRCFKLTTGMRVSVKTFTSIARFSTKGGNCPIVPAGLQGLVCECGFPNCFSLGYQASQFRPPIPLLVKSQLMIRHEIFHFNNNLDAITGVLRMQH